MWHYINHSYLAVVVAFATLAPDPFPAAAQESRKGPQAFKVTLTKADVTDQDDAENRLLKERFNAAVDEWLSMSELREFGQITAADPELLSAIQRAVSAGLELHRRPVERIKLLDQYVKFTTAADEATSSAAESGKVGAQERHRARYYRRDAELQLLRETKRMN